MLVFQLPPEIAPVAKYLQFEGGYKSEFDQNNWSTLKMSSLLLNGKVAYLNLDQLYYSFASYDFRVRIKSKMARKKISWSDYAITTFKTRPSIPNTAPNSCQSCYHQINNGNIFLYWKEIERSSQNGPGFGYFLVGSSNGSEFFKNATFKTHLLLENLPNGELKFLIYSLNSVGSSTVATEVIVLNSKVLQVANPFKVRKELIEDHKYRISWTNKHQDQYLIDNFIVFWCSSKNDLPNNCEGSIDFQYVASNESSFERQTKLTSNFAVSVNYFNVSRTMSMVWAECTAAGANGTRYIKTYYNL